MILQLYSNFNQQNLQKTTKFALQFGFYQSFYFETQCQLLNHLQGLIRLCLALNKTQGTVPIPLRNQHQQQPSLNFSKRQKSVKIKKMLQNYLNQLLLLQQVRISKIIAGFLQIKDRKEFENFKKQFMGKFQFNRDSIQSQKGRILVQITQNLKMKQQIIENINSQDFKIFSEILNNLNSLITLYQRQIKTLSNISENFNKLYQTTFSSQICNKKLNDLCKVYMDFSKLFEQQRKQVIKKTDLIKNDLIEQFNDLKEQQKNFQFLKKQRNKIQEEYLKYHMELIKKKKKLYQKGNIESWNINPKEKEYLKIQILHNKQMLMKYMCHQQSQIEAKKKEMLGIANAKVFEMMSYGLERKLQKQKLILIQFKNKLQKSIIDQLQMLKNINMKNITNQLKLYY